MTFHLRTLPCGADGTRTRISPRSTRGACQLATSPPPPNLQGGGFRLGPRLLPAGHLPVQFPPFPAGHLSFPQVIAYYGRPFSQPPVEIGRPRLHVAEPIPAWLYLAGPKLFPDGIYPDLQGNSSISTPDFSGPKASPRSSPHPAWQAMLSYQSGHCDTLPGFAPGFTPLGFGRIPADLSCGAGAETLRPTVTPLPRGSHIATNHAPAG